MKKIIGGRKYDTETAKQIGVDAYGCDFSKVYETLYRKKNGEFFIHYDGGPMSDYAVHVDANTWGAGQKIVPVTEEQAKAWVEQHMDAEAYEAVFGEVEE